MDTDREPRLRDKIPCQPGHDLGRVNQRDHQVGLALLQVSHQLREAKHLADRVEADAQLPDGAMVRQRPAIARINKVDIIAGLVQRIGDENCDPLRPATGERGNKHRDFSLFQVTCAPKLIPSDGKPVLDLSLSGLEVQRDEALAARVVEECKIAGGGSAAGMAAEPRRAHAVGREG